MDKAIKSVESLLRGKSQSIQLSFACLLAGGHLLLEDLPGMGKTTLAMALAKVLGLQYARVQFTSDLLPSDILGSTIFDKDSSSFRFHQGPIFNQLLLADEINRSTPKTQSALLEAMSERSISVDGTSYPLPQPFFVIATQNPLTQLGTYPLPESQLDRFMLSISLGYPDAHSERLMLKGVSGRELLEQVTAQLSAEKILQMQKLVQSINLSDALLDYVQALIAATRQHPDLQYGISPRGALALVKAAKAWAFIQRRDFVIPEDIQLLIKPVFLHRLTPAAHSAADALAIIDAIVQQTAVS